MNIQWSILTKSHYKLLANVIGCVKFYKCTRLIIKSANFNNKDVKEKEAMPIKKFDDIERIIQRGRFFTLKLAQINEFVNFYMKCELNADFLIACEYQMQTE